MDTMNTSQCKQRVQLHILVTLIEECLSCHSFIFNCANKVYLIKFTIKLGEDL
jgi:hypothetical protein